MNFKQYLLENADWMIEFVKDGTPYFVNIERDGRVSLVPQSPSAFSHCSKWKVKERAEKVLAKMPAGATLVPTYGGYVYGGKAAVSPLPVKRRQRWD